VQPRLEALLPPLQKPELLQRQPPRKLEPPPPPRRKLEQPLLPRKLPKPEPLALPPRKLERPLLLPRTQEQLVPPMQAKLESLPLPAQPTRQEPPLVVRMRQREQLLVVQRMRERQELQLMQLQLMRRRARRLGPQTKAARLAMGHRTQASEQATSHTSQ
jgi:hypothetical protein